MAPRRREPAAEFEQYVVAVSAWDVQWLFSIADLKRAPGPYREFTDLVLYGTVHRPAPFRYPRAEVTLSGRPALAGTDDAAPPGTWFSHSP